MGRGFEDYVFRTYSTQRNTHKHCPQTKQCHVWHHMIIYTLSLHLPVHAALEMLAYKKAMITKTWD